MRAGKEVEGRDRTHLVTRRLEHGEIARERPGTARQVGKPVRSQFVRQCLEQRRLQTRARRVHVAGTAGMMCRRATIRAPAAGAARTFRAARRRRAHCMRAQSTAPPASSMPSPDAPACIHCRSVEPIPQYRSSTATPGAGSRCSRASATDSRMQVGQQLLERRRPVHESCRVERTSVRPRPGASPSARTACGRPTAWQWTHSPSMPVAGNPARSASRSAGS